MREGCLTFPLSSRALTTSLSCSCGKVKAQITSEDSLRLICYCNDCRNYWNVMVERNPLNPPTDPWGGVDHTQITLPNFQITQGIEEVRAIKMHPTSTIFKVYAGCCFTPLYTSGMACLVNTHLLNESDKGEVYYRIMGRNSIKSPASFSAGGSYQEVKERPSISWSIPLSWIFTMSGRARMAGRFNKKAFTPTSEQLELFDEWKQLTNKSQRGLGSSGPSSSTTAPISSKQPTTTKSLAPSKLPVFLNAATAAKSSSYKPASSLNTTSKGMPTTTITTTNLHKSNALPKPKKDKENEGPVSSSLDSSAPRSIAPASAALNHQVVAPIKVNNISKPTIARKEVSVATSVILNPKSIAPIKERQIQKSFAPSFKPKVAGEPLMKLEHKSGESLKARPVFKKEVVKDKVEIETKLEEPHILLQNETAIVSSPVIISKNNSSPLPPSPQPQPQMETESNNSPIKKAYYSPQFSKTKSPQPKSMKIGETIAIIDVVEKKKEEVVLTPSKQKSPMGKDLKLSSVEEAKHARAPSSVPPAPVLNIMQMLTDSPPPASVPKAKKATGRRKKKEASLIAQEIILEDIVVEAPKEIEVAPAAEEPQIPSELPILLLKSCLKPKIVKKSGGKKQPVLKKKSVAFSPSIQDKGPPSISFTSSLTNAMAAISTGGSKRVSRKPKFLSIFEGHQPETKVEEKEDDLIRKAKLLSGLASLEIKDEDFNNEALSDILGSKTALELDDKENVISAPTRRDTKRGSIGPPSRVVKKNVKPPPKELVQPAPPVQTVSKMVASTKLSRTLGLLMVEGGMTISNPTVPPPSILATSMGPRTRSQRRENTFQ